MKKYHEELLSSIRDLRREMKKISYELYKDGELTLPQLGVVAVLTENGPSKVSDISGQVGLANSTVSGIIDRLEKKDIVKRNRLEEDRRTVVISLTEGSEKYYEEYKSRRDSYMLEKMEKLDEEEAGDLTESVRRLISLLSGVEK
ncbi:MAG: MarR family transcriptional regulator [Spirochaetales bacterium]|nr:MarR family transcriptional regulator [Spirochaetales bacterium]